METYLKFAKIVFSGFTPITRQFKVFENGVPETYGDATEASISTERNSISMLISAQKDAGAHSFFAQTMLCILDRQIEGGNGNKGLVALMNEFIPNNRSL